MSKILTASHQGLFSDWQKTKLSVKTKINVKKYLIMFSGLIYY